MSKKKSAQPKSKVTVGAKKDPKADYLVNLKKLQEVALATEEEPLPEKEPVPFDPCVPPSDREGPQFQLQFRKPVELERIISLTPKAGAAADHQIACLPISSGHASLGLDVRMNQIWNLQSQKIGDLASTMSLAPAERLELRIRKTQRSLIEETVLNSSESIDSFESSVIDKDVVSVTRTSAKTDKWNIDGSASISLGGFAQLGASAGVSSSVEGTAKSSIERISEATQKSSSQLKTLQKVEVGRTTETFLESEQTRKVVNPYHDRTLVLNIFELSKHYCVTTKLATLVPILVMEIADLLFDWKFVTSNGDFLELNLLDRKLALELQESLDSVQRQVGPGAAAVARDHARAAFRWLFEEPDIFNTQISTAGGVVDGDLPSSSFNASLPTSALDDAVAVELTDVFVTLNYFYKVHQGLRSDASLSEYEKRERELGLAVALHDAIAPWWETATSEQKAHVSDTHDFTEIFRRLPGFLVYVKALMKPLLTPIEEEREASAAAAEAAYVIERVVDHVDCHRSYYVSRFLKYISELSHGFALADTLRKALPTTLRDDLLDLFDFRAGFLDGFQYVVPFSQRFSVEEALKELEALVPDRPFNVARIRPKTIDVTVPADGVFIEAVAGECVLVDVPAPTPSLSFRTELETEAHDGSE